MHSTCFGAVGIVLLYALPALAQPTPPSSRIFGTEDDPRPDMRPRSRIVMRLDYIRAPGAEACPDEQGFRDAVGSHVRRWDPFAPNGPWRLVVLVSRSGNGYVGSAELRDESGVVVLKRAYPSTPMCHDLVGDLARSVGFKVDPPAPPVDPPAPPVDPPPAEPSRSPESPSPAPPPHKPLGLRLGLGTWMDLATAPRPALGLSIDVGMRVAWFSIAVEGRFNPPAGATVRGSVDVSTTRVQGALVPCGHIGWFAGCLLGELGQISGSIGVPGVTPDSVSVRYSAAGVRLAAEIPAMRHLLVRIAADLTGARPATFRLNGQQQWETASFTGGLGVGLIATF